MLLMLIHRFIVIHFHSFIVLQIASSTSCPQTDLQGDGEPGLEPGFNMSFGSSCLGFDCPVPVRTCDGTGIPDALTPREHPNRRELSFRSAITMKIHHFSISWACYQHLYHGLIVLNGLLVFHDVLGGPRSRSSKTSRHISGGWPKRAVELLREKGIWLTHSISVCRSNCRNGRSEVQWTQCRPYLAMIVDLIREPSGKRPPREHNCEDGEQITYPDHRHVTMETIRASDPSRRTGLLPPPRLPLASGDDGLHAVIKPTLGSCSETITGRRRQGGSSNDQVDGVLYPLGYRHSMG
ncbi:hypothetical protein V8F33_004598 [Rhypophila sp. PSN 637]